VKARLFRIVIVIALFAVVAGVVLQDLVTINGLKWG